MITGAAGLLAAWVITLDKFKLLEDPETSPPAAASTRSSPAATSWRASRPSAFGFPNPMLGLVAYGDRDLRRHGLLAGARFPRWYWLAFNAGTLFGVGFCTWLQYQSLYDINSLCLWCCLAWVATIVMFWYVTVAQRQHRLPARARLAAQGLLASSTGCCRCCGSASSAC